jgi:hypothetical protein
MMLIDVHTCMFATPRYSRHYALPTGGSSVSTTVQVVVGYLYVDKCTQNMYKICT